MSNTAIQTVGQIGIPVKQIERSIKFYRDQLGLDFLFQTDSLAFFDCNDVRLFLSLPEQESYAQSSSVIYFSVEDLHQTYKEWRTNGVEFIDEPHLIAKIGSSETWMTFFKDTEGNTLAIMSEFEK